MAALYRAPEGMLMSDLSRFLLVSNGNVTGIVDRLVSEGLVARAQAQRRPPHLDGAADRGGHRRSSDAMAAAHEGWIGELLGGVSEDETRRLAAMLKSFRSNWEGRE